MVNSLTCLLTTALTLEREQKAKEGGGGWEIALEGVGEGERTEHMQGQYNY